MSTSVNSMKTSTPLVKVGTREYINPQQIAKIEPKPLSKNNTMIIVGTAPLSSTPYYINKPVEEVVKKLTTPSDSPVLDLTV